MHLSGSGPEALRAQLGLTINADGAVEWPGLAQLIRQAVGRWSLVRRADLQRFVLKNLSAAEVDDGERVEAAIERLSHLREVQVVAVDEALPHDDDRRALLQVREVQVAAVDEALSHEDAKKTIDTRAPRPGSYLAAIPLRHIPVGDRLLICGASEPSSLSVEVFGSYDEPTSIARWGRLVDAEQWEGLGSRGVEVEDWLGAPGWLDHLERRKVPPGGLEELWTALEDSLERFGAPIDEASRCAAICGPPGGYFGHAEKRDGRWCSGDATPDGRWCGVLQGHSTRHLRPAIIEARGGRAVRALDLFDFDELRWALLSRGLVRQPEVLRVRGASLELTFPCPTQWLQSAALCHVDGWRWTPPPWLGAERLREWLPGSTPSQ